MSMHDLGILATRIITEFPEYYGYFGLTEFPYDGRAPQNRFNRNPILPLGIGADGLKTGHTVESGYGLVGSAVQGGRRVVVVLTGLASEKERAEEAERVINWAFREFVEKTVAKKGTRIADAPVWLGSSGQVGLAVADDVTLLVPSIVQDKLSAEVNYTGPIQAPVSQGQKLAEMVVTVPGLPAVSVPLVADSAVAKGGFGTHMRTAFQLLSQRLVAEIGS